MSLKTDSVQQNPVTRGQLHILVRNICLKNKICLKALSPDYRRVAQQSLMELLKVQALKSEHESALTYFCRQVPQFYKKCKGNLRSILKKHKEFFDLPLFEASDSSR